MLNKNITAEKLAPCWCLNIKRSYKDGLSVHVIPAGSHNPGLPVLMAPFSLTFALCPRSAPLLYPDQATAVNAGPAQPHAFHGCPPPPLQQHLQVTEAHGQRPKKPSRVASWGVLCPKNRNATSKSTGFAFLGV